MSFIASDHIEDIKGFATIISGNNHSCVIGSRRDISYVARYSNFIFTCIIRKCSEKNELLLKAYKNNRKYKM